MWLARGQAHVPGPRLAVKDLFDTATLETTYGSRIFCGHHPDTTAPAVARLQSAGYRLVGKTNLDEFGFGTTSQNPHFGKVHNPLDPGRSPGGSSGGNAAALLRGECDLALGTDTSGSVRVPAACCGIVGFKPTRGLIPLDRCWPLAPSFDHGGLMARTVVDCAAAMHAFVPGFRPAHVALKDLAVHVVWLDGSTSGVRRRVSTAASRFGLVRHVALDLDHGVEPLFDHDLAQVHRELFPAHETGYGHALADRLRRAARVTAVDAARGEEARQRFEAAAEAALAGADLLLAPTLTTVAPRLDPTGRVAFRITELTRPANSLGWPSLSLPCGPAEDRLPASLQLIGRPDSDALVLGAGLALEATLRTGPEGTVGDSPRGRSA